MPIIFYGIPIYFTNSRGCISRIEKIQKYFTKRLFLRLNPHQIVPKYDDRLTLFKLFPLEASCVASDLSLLFKILNKTIDVLFCRFSVPLKSPALCSKVLYPLHTVNASFIALLSFGISISLLVKSFQFHPSTIHRSVFSSAENSFILFTAALHRLDKLCAPIVSYIKLN